MDFIAIERAGFSSWPALEESETDGIVLRFANGYTKRANSANLLRKLDNDFSTIEKHYHAFFQHKNLPSIFRLPSFTDNQPFDHFLAQSGYRQIDRSLVLYQPLDSAWDEVVELSECDSQEWMNAFCEINERPLDEHQTHVEMIDRIEGKTLRVVLREDGEDIACGLGVISNGLLGLFDIVTKASARNQGYGTRLIKGMQHWAIANGATASYLQVVADNLPARKLYEKLGYQLCYEYWYRLRD